MLYFLYVFYKYIFGVPFGLHSNKILTTFLPLKEKKKKNPYMRICYGISLIISSYCKITRLILVL